ncbi:MAG TPA: hypothetical protein VI306_05470 [Pyrinomonadaceae bacterium]
MNIIRRLATLEDFVAERRMNLASRFNGWLLNEGNEASRSDA